MTLRPRCIFFDIGGVLLSADFKKSVRSYVELLCPGQGPEGFEKLKRTFFTAKGNTYFQEASRDTQAEKALLEINASMFNEALGVRVTSAEVAQIYSRVWTGRLETNIAAFKKLSGLYSVGLISDLIGTSHQMALELLSDVFAVVPPDRTFISHQCGMRKSDGPQWFMDIQAKAGIPAGEMLLIDDGADNLAHAAEAGWQTILCPAQSDITDLLAQLM